jgi:hypothetical protein
MKVRTRTTVVTSEGRSSWTRRTMKAPLRRIPARTLLAVATAAGLLFAVPAVASADPDNLPVLYGGDDSFAHQCKVIGVAVRGYEAVVCSDLQAGDGGTMDNPYYYVDGQTEAYCQTISGTVVGCEGVEVSAQLSSGAGVVGTGGYECGTFDSSVACAGDGQRNYVPDGGEAWWITVGAEADCATDLGSYNQVWNVVFGGSGVTEVQLPNSGAVETLTVGNDGGNQSTGHYFICP